jgi:hypothetical protein
MWQSSSSRAPESPVGIRGTHLMNSCIESTWNIIAKLEPVSTFSIRLRILPNLSLLLPTIHWAILWMKTLNCIILMDSQALGRGSCFRKQLSQPLFLDSWKCLGWYFTRPHSWPEGGAWIRVSGCPFGKHCWFEGDLCWLSPWLLCSLTGVGAGYSLGAGRVEEDVLLAHGQHSEEWMSCTLALKRNWDGVEQWFCLFVSFWFLFVICSGSSLDFKTCAFPVFAS